MKRIYAIALVLLAISESANAGIDCAEKITQLIMHSNGDVFFLTNKTCTTAWCQIGFTTSDAKNKAYAMLLTATTAGKTVVFHWPAISSCSAQTLFIRPPSIYG